MGFRLDDHENEKNTPHQNSIVEDSDDRLVKQAITFAKKNGLKTCPLDVRGIAEYLGARIISGDSLPADVVGRVTVDPKNPEKCEIRLNMKMNPYRLRFTLAHELGHYLKHQHWSHKDITTDDLPASVSFNRSSKMGGQEWEANVFAAQILMPEAEIKSAMGKGYKLDDLAEIFEVSKRAMKIRLEDLDLLTD